jgi:alpha-glucosidase
VSPELYTRWIQFGVFSPVLRTHTTKNPSSERRIWAYPVDDFHRMRDAFLLRYALMPYLYTSARETYETGVSICHPLYYDYPESGEAYTSTGEYLFGDQMLVAPVVSPVSRDSMLAAQSLWIPPGEWFEWQTGSLLKGPSATTRCYALDEIPVFLRAGAIIPMQPPMRTSAEKPVDPLILLVAPGDSGSTRVYEDAGNSTGYERGEGTWTPVRWRKGHGGSLTIAIEPAQGKYPGMPLRRSYEIVLPGIVPPEGVTSNGRALAWTREEGAEGWAYDGEHASVLVRTGSFPLTERVTVLLTMPSDAASLGRTLDGFPGRLARLRRVMPILNNQWPMEWSPGTLVHAAQTGNRLGINPGAFRDELARFGPDQQEIQKAVRGMEIPDSVRARVLNHLTSGF